MTDAIVEIIDDLSSGVIEITEQPSVPIIEIDSSTVETVIEVLGTETLAGPQGLQGVPGPAIFTYSAGIDLSGHRMVVLDDSALVVYADNTVDAHANKVIGMTTGAAMVGAGVTIQAGGELTEPSWDWTLNIPVWLGVNGLLTQAVPVSGFSLIIGFPISQTSIFIDIHEPIFLI